MKISINKLSELTGIERSTIRKHIRGLKSEKGEKNSQLYESSDALELLYRNYTPQNHRVDSDGYNPSQEKARLDRKKADLVELQYYEKLGSLVPIETVRSVWSSLILSVRSHILAVPSKLKSLPKQIRVQISTEINKALSELQNINESEYFKNGQQQIPADD